MMNFQTWWKRAPICSWKEFPSQITDGIIQRRIYNKRIY
jgi:hypothetical protein